GSDRAGDVRPVAVAVGVGVAGRAVDTADDVQVRVSGVDAGVDDGHVDVDRAAAIAGQCRARVRPDPLDARGDALGWRRTPAATAAAGLALVATRPRDRGDTVLLDEQDPPVVGDPCCGGGAHLGGVALERRAVDVTDSSAVLLRVLTGDLAGG